MIDGTGMRVIDVAESHVAYRWDADQLVRQYPALNLQQVHSALGYYYAHKAELDAHMNESFESAIEICRQHEDAAIIRRLSSRTDS